MNTYFLIAGILCFLLAIAHSAIGEYLIFRHKRKKGNLVPTKRNEGLRERHLRILWATWHLTSVFGICLGIFILKIGTDYQTLNSEFSVFLIRWTIYAMLLSSVLVLVGTKGKHPGWIVLLVIGVLLIIGNI